MAAAPDPGAFPASDPTVHLAAMRFEGEVDCGPSSTDPHRAWCAVTRAAIGPFPPPSSTIVRLGLTMELTSRPVPESLLDTTSPAVLIVGPTEARVRGIVPSNPEEGVELAAVVFQIASVLKGDGTEVAVSDGLAGYLEGLATDAGHPVTHDGAGASFTGKLPSRMHRVTGEPSVWVAVETAPDGLFVSVFPDVPWTK